MRERRKRKKGKALWSRNNCGLDVTPRARREKKVGQGPITRFIETELPNSAPQEERGKKRKKKIHPKECRPDPFQARGREGKKKKKGEEPLIGQQILLAGSR